MYNINAHFFYDMHYPDILYSYSIVHFTEKKIAIGNMKCDPMISFRFDENCCTQEKPCSDGQGHCTDDKQCMNDLGCHKDNCGSLFPSGFDCCGTIGNYAAEKTMRNYTNKLALEDIYLMQS